MNILPKKSWHVLSRDNVLRVRRDEAEAKAKEEEQQKRADLAEKEARLEYMRRQAREREGVATTSTAGELTADTLETSQRHINLFTDLQHGVGVQAVKNKDHESEEKKEREKFEKRVGILNYLVDKDKLDDPWYVRDKKKDEQAERSRKRAALQDPLIKMNEFLEKKRKAEEKASGSASVMKEPVSLKPKVSDDRHTRKKHKKKKKKSSSSDLDRLRRERKCREEAERVKEEDLLQRYHGLESTSEAVPSTATILPERKYNSQFNPHLARQK